MVGVKHKDDLFKDVKEFLEEKVGQEIDRLSVNFKNKQIMVYYDWTGNFKIRRFTFDEYANWIQDRAIQKICDNAFEEDKDAITKAVRRLGND